MKINLDIKTEYYIKQLGKKTGQLQEVAATTLNESAEEINKNYKLNLRRGAKLRNKYSLNSVKIFKANPVSRSGEPRPISKLNAIVGVRKQKGSKDHYLKKLEEGGVTRGNPLTLGRVPVPLAAARIGGNDNKAVARGNRLTTAKTQTLKINGRKIGRKNDGYRSTGARWGSVYRAVRTGKIQGDPKKPFYFIDNRGKSGIFKMKRKRIGKIRSIEKTMVRRKAEPHFYKAVKQESPARIKQRFIKNAKKRLT